MQRARRQQIEAIAHSIREWQTVLAGLGEPLTREDVEQTNREGWTVERSASLGSVLRTEGVILTASELDLACELAALAGRVRGSA